LVGLLTLTSSICEASSVRLNKSLTETIQISTLISGLPGSHKSGIIAILNGAMRKIALKVKDDTFVKYFQDKISKEWIKIGKNI
jgi:hypothetical protein